MLILILEKVIFSVCVSLIVLFLVCFLVVNLGNVNVRMLLCGWFLWFMVWVVMISVCVEFNFLDILIMIFG